MKNFIFFIIAFFPATILIAQNTLTQNSADQYYITGVELLDKEKFGAARYAFEHYLALAGDEGLKAVEAQYYIAYSALRLYHADGEKLVENFIHQYEGHPKALLAYYEMGNFYFREKNYAKAIKYLTKVDITGLSKSQREEAQFKLAYAHFARQEFEKALEQLNAIKAYDNRYTYAASYYAGYIEYRQGDYDQALTDLKRAEKNETYAAIVPYMIANVYYKQENYDGMQQYAENAVKRPNIQNKDEIYLLIAEAYYKKKDYAKAASNFEDYLANKKGKPDAAVLYRIGYAQYMNGNNAHAIENFKQVAAVGDTLGQFASYYLGELYIKEDNKMFAVTAFDVAAKQDFSSEIKSQALFKLGKVNYDIGHYDQAIAILNTFVKNYPKANETSEANELLSEAYLNSNDYAQALKHIEGLPVKTDRIKRAYQKVAFYKGAEYFNDARFYNAVQMFEKSLEFPLDKAFVVMSHFWAGEAYNTGRKYDEAINEYSAVFRNTHENDIYFIKSRYGIGYAYFNKKEYEKALPHFRVYVSKLQNASNRLFYNDALIRLADCYYTTKDYSRALQYYDEAIKEKNPDLDYAYYQKGVIQGLQGSYANAKTSLQVVTRQYPNSRFADDAAFEMAQLEFEQGHYEAAIAGFSSLVRSKPQSEFVPYALMRAAIAYTNLQQYEQAQENYRALLEGYITHELAGGAISGMQQVLTQLGRNDEFDHFLSQYKMANPDDESLSSIEYEAAKNLYFNQRYEKAIPSFQDYIRQYPNTASAYESKFYIAESYFRLDNKGEAINYYEQVIEDNKIAQTSRAVQRVAELSLQSHDFNKAIRYFNDLASIARTKREQYNAWSGLMEAYYQTERYDSVSYYGQLILERGNVNANAESKANLFLGKAAYSQGNNQEAMDYFLTTLNTAKDENGAEAQWLLAEIQYKNGEYATSIETLYDLNSNFSAYEFWLGRSFLLIADNYIALEENFQARATLNSLVERSPLPEIVEMARRKLRDLDESQAKQTDELEVDTTTFQIIEN